MSRLLSRRPSALILIGTALICLPQVVSLLILITGIALAPTYVVGSLASLAIVILIAGLHAILLCRVAWSFSHPGPPS